MPKVARTHIAYRYEPFTVSDAEDEKHWDAEGYAPINLDTAVPVPAQPRRLDWTRILKHVAFEDYPTVKRAVLKDYLDLFIDGDHKVVLVNGILRFKQSKLEALLCEVVDLNELCVKRQKSLVTLADYRAYYRKIGYSLCGSFDISQLGHHGLFTRKLTETGDAVRDEDCPVWLLQ